LVWHSENFIGGGTPRTYTTSDGSTFAFNQVPVNPGRAELYASDIAFMSGMSQDDPPTIAQQVNFTTVDGATWSDVSAAPGSPWNIAVSPSFTEMFFFRVAGLFVTFLKNTDDYFTSPDGVTWTQRTGPWSSPFNPVFNSYGSDGVNDFLAASFGQLYTTTDAISWTLIEPSVSAGRFVYAGSNGALADKYWLFGGTGFGNARVESSLDGSAGSWSRNLTAEANLDAVGVIGFNNPFGVAYSNSIGGGTFVLKFQVAGAGSGTTRLAVSTDGVNWMNPGLTFFSASPPRYSATLGIFVATSGSSTEAALLKSGNGTTWTKTVYAAFGAIGAHASSDILVSF
jgi:hypothetical protein